MAAAGFAIGDVTLANCLDRHDLLPSKTANPDCVAILGGESERLEALGDLAELRRAGFSIQYPLKNQGFGKQFKNADKSGARVAIIYGADELAGGNVKIRDLGTGEETMVKRSSLAQKLGQLLSK